jgi:hypothetical protein
MCSFAAGIISQANQQVWHIDESGFEHSEVGNTTVDVIEPVVDGITAFLYGQISPGNVIHSVLHLYRKERPSLNTAIAPKRFVMRGHIGWYSLPGKVS